MLERCSRRKGDAVVNLRHKRAACAVNQTSHLSVGKVGQGREMVTRLRGRSEGARDRALGQGRGGGREN